MEMLALPMVTLLCVETRDPELAHWAIERCWAGTAFAKTVLITSVEKIKERKAGIEYVQAPIIKNTKDYSELLLSGLRQYVEGTHVLVIQWDSFITHSQLWRDEFLKYDYIGPVWPHHPNTPVGNGGFSLRSMKLLNAISKPGFIKKHPEDYCICADNKFFLENECGINIAPVSVAEEFAVERTAWHDAFGFHGFFNFGRVLNESELESFIKILPDAYLSGLDSYDLIAYLMDHGRVNIAKEIAKKVHFKWKMRKRYVRLKYWLSHS